jgi:hypothetical protein
MSDPNLFKLLGGYLHKKTKGERVIKLTKKISKKSQKKVFKGGKRSRTKRSRTKRSRTKRSTKLTKRSSKRRSTTKRVNRK